MKKKSFSVKTNKKHLLYFTHNLRKFKAIYVANGFKK